MKKSNESGNGNSKKNPKTQVATVSERLRIKEALAPLKEIDKEFFTIQLRACGAMILLSSSLSDLREKFSINNEPPYDRMLADGAQMLAMDAALNLEAFLERVQSIIGNVLRAAKV